MKFHTSWLFLEKTQCCARGYGVTTCENGTIILQPRTRTTVKPVASAPSQLAILLRSLPQSNGCMILRMCYWILWIMGIPRSWPTLPSGHFSQQVLLLIQAKSKTMMHHLTFVALAFASHCLALPAEEKNLFQSSPASPNRPFAGFPAWYLPFEYDTQECMNQMRRGC